MESGHEQQSANTHLLNIVTTNLNNIIMSDANTMYVTKRGGEKEEVSFDKITKRLKKLSSGLSINTIELAQVIIAQIYDGIRTTEIDELAAGTCASRISTNPDYGIMASRIIISNHHKFTSNSFSEVVQQLCDNRDPLGEASPIINDEIYKLVMSNKEKINSVIDYNRDYKFDYFGFKTLERAYLLKVGDKVIERPQHMFMRVSLAIHRDDIKEAIKTYHEMSEGYFTHATPTLFNMGTQREQAASCFLLAMQKDSIEGIYKTLAQCAEISKNAGGIGLHIHNIRAKNSYIRGTNGYSNGIVPMLRNFNATSRYVDQGGQKRPGSIAIYLEPWHADIEDFLMLRRNTGNPEERCRDLFYAMWIPDLFMERVEADANWTLMCPDKCPGLADVWGDKFKELYERYEHEKRGMRVVPARKIWTTIIESQIETGQPYIMFKDAVNRKSNQQNLGTIKSSNLCVAEDTEIILEDGIHVIKDLVNQRVNVWNGFEFSEVEVKQTGTAQVMDKIEFSNGSMLVCTPEHKFYIATSIENCKYMASNETTIKNVFAYTQEYRAADLTEGMMLMSYYLPFGGELKNIKYNKEFLKAKNCITITKITRNYTVGDTYCFTEPLKHLGVFNGIVTGQCAEILEYSSPDEIAVCNLLSVCLPKYLERPTITEPIKIYSKSACKYCDLSKNMLTKMGYVYTEVNLDDDTVRKEFFGNLNTQAIAEQNPEGCIEGVCQMPVGGLITTVPQIFIGDKRIGGYNELREYLKPVFNFKKLRDITKMAVRNLNKLIDYNYYPVPETYNSNMRHRPIGIGIQGLADVFAQLRTPFESAEAVEMSRKIAEHMYLAACQASMDIARKRKKHIQDYRRIYKKPEAERTDEEKALMHDIKSKYVIHVDEVEKLPMGLAGAYSSFVGSPASHGILQFDMWGVQPSPELAEEWSMVKEDIKKHGLRNSLLMAMMPTASTSQIMGNNECIEPFTNNIYKRQTLAGNFTIINKYLVADLMALGLWSSDMKDKIILQNGSVQEIPEIPETIKKLYRTVWEIKQKYIVDHARARAPFICQTQSMNLFFEDLSYSKINACHFYSWKAGLKTGIYYLRSKAKTQAQKFSVDASKIVNANSTAASTNEEGCVNCSA